MRLSLDLRRERKSLRRAGRLRTKSRQIDWILWGIPIFLVVLSGLLIASTQRQANYADWYNHWIVAIIGLSLAFAVSLFPLDNTLTI